MVCFDAGSYKRGRISRRKTGTTGSNASDRQVRAINHELSLIKDAPEQKGMTKKQAQGNCAACASERDILVASQLNMQSRRGQKVAKMKAPRTGRSSTWCRACGIACCALCYFKLKPHGGQLNIPGRMGLFSRPNTRGRTGPKAETDGTYDLLVVTDGWMDRRMEMDGRLHGGGLMDRYNI
jgi:hypothetical protein